MTGPYAPRQPGTLKDAVTQLVAACGGLAKAAALARVRRTQIHRYTDPAEPECHMPLDIVLALETHCGDPIVTAFMAFESGALLVPLRAGQSEAFAGHLAKLGRETGRLYGEACGALKDGCHSKAESTKVEREALKTVEALAALIADLRAARA